MSPVVENAYRRLTNTTSQSSCICQGVTDCRARRQSFPRQTRSQSAENDTQFSKRGFLSRLYSGKVTSEIQLLEVGITAEMESGKFEGPGGGGADDVGDQGDTAGNFVQWTLWQLCDSGLPTGGFAHSAGLEAAAAQGIVKAKDSGSLRRFVRGVLANAAHLQLPLMREAYAAKSLDDWVRVDSLTHACITGEAARRASVAQGGGLLRAVQAMLPLEKDRGEMMRQFRALLRGGTRSPGGHAIDGAIANAVAYGHHAPAFGVVCGSLGVSEAQAARAYMFLVARDVLSAATRLSLIGPLEAGRLVSNLSQYAEALVAKGEGEQVRDTSWVGEHAPWANTTFEGDREWNDKGFDAFQVDPIQDIVQGLHDRLYSRMFNS